MAQVDERDDSLLVARCHENNEEAFGELYQKHFESVKKILMSKTGVSEHDACDIVQKSFIKAMRGIKSFKCQCSFRTWIYRIAYNTFLDSVRGEKNVISIELLTEKDIENHSLAQESDDESPSFDIECFELSERIKQAREKLNQNQKQIFDLIFVEGKSYKDASTEMNVPVGTVMSRVHYTRKRLSKLLQEVT